MGASEKVMFSKLNLVDLAGSERLKKTMADGDDAPVRGKTSQQQVDETIKKESMYINQSLTYLEQCVVALAKRGNVHVPYRQTKLTSVLKDSLGGNCNTLMFAAVWGEAKHLEETVSTLKLAQRMMRVQNDVGINVQTDPAMLVKKYERQIKELKQELMMHDTLAERSNVMYDEYTPEQRLQMSQWVRSYVDAQENSEPELKIESVRHVQELMRQFKALVKTAESNALQIRSQSRAGGMVDFDGTAETGALGGMTQSFPENEGDFVGDIDDEGGFGVGAAPDFARPTTVDNIATRRGMLGADSKSNNQGSPQKTRDTGDAKVSMPSPADAKNSLHDKDESFAMYKINQGQELNSELADAKAKFKLAKQRTKNAADAVNQTKREIDEVEEQLRLKEDERERTQNKVEGMEDFVDEEEFRLMTTRKEKKREYRANFEDLKMLKAEMGQASNKVEASRSALLSGFETWYAALISGSEDPDEDKLDEAEAFDQLEISRVVDTDPDSLAFFQSQKKMRGMQNANKNTLKASQRAKRR
jgi:kinesin family protein 6/9